MLVLPVITDDLSVKSNSIALNALNNGASSLMIHIKSHKDISTILKKIQLDICPIHFSGNIDQKLISASIKIGFFLSKLCSYLSKVSEYKVTSQLPPKSFN